jgi:hypothetical protein
LKKPISENNVNIKKKIENLEKLIGVGWKDK